MRVTLSLFAFVIALAGVGCGSSARLKAELAQLQGKWLVVKDGDGEIDPYTHYVISGDKVRLVCVDSIGQKVEMDRFRLRLDPDHSPKRVDLENIGPSGEDLSHWTRSRSQHTGRRSGPYRKVEYLAPSIYKLDGDTLTICVGNGKDDRPTMFDLTAYPRSLVLKRAPAGK
jgi:uncharacterized protein (TIGR03067 family)